MINISVNGKYYEFNEQLNVDQLFELLNYNKKGFSIAINSMFVAISEYKNVNINDGDKIDILAPVQGG